MRYRPARTPSARASWRAQLGLLAAAFVAAACGASGVAVPSPMTGEGAPRPSATPGGAVLSPTPSGAAGSPTVRPTPGPTVPRVAPLQAPAYASRIVLPALGIDLPVISGDLQPPPSYPLCDVAAYVTRFGQPYESGVTYISAHAQEGMFLPLLQASERADGAELLGLPVSVFTNDGRRFDYRIERVVRHAVDYAVIGELALDERHLILQTSEGPYGTLEKLQVIAGFESEAPDDVRAARPLAQPRDCRPDELGG